MAFSLRAQRSLSLRDSRSDKVIVVSPLKEKVFYVR